jgi:hypothetical protein
LKRSVVLALLVAIVTAAIQGAVPNPAQAAAGVVYVDVAVNQAWPVSRAVAYVDTFTRSTMRFGQCRNGSRCIAIRENWSINPSWGAVTYPGSPRTTMQLNPYRRTTSYDQRLHILVHELGHANGVYEHTATCASIMYFNVQCPGGRFAPLTFTAAERVILAAN